MEKYEEYPSLGRFVLHTTDGRPTCTLVVGIVKELL